MEDGECAEDAPRGAVHARDDIESAEGFGVIEVERGVGGEDDEVEGSLAIFRSSSGDRVDPEAAVLVEARVELALRGVHLRESAEGDHLIGLIGIEVISADDLGALGVGVVEDVEFCAVDGVGVDVCAAGGGGNPGAGEGEDFFAGPGGAVAVEEFVDGGGGEAPVDGEEEDRRGEEDEKGLRDDEAEAHPFERVVKSWHGRYSARAFFCQKKTAG